MAKKEETKIQDAVRIALSKSGCKVFRCNVGNFYTKWGSEIKIGTPGHSDLYGVKPGGKAFFFGIKNSYTEALRIFRRILLELCNLWELMLVLLVLWKTL